MINNSTSSLDTKVSYTSVDTTSKAPVSNPAPVADAPAPSAGSANAAQQQAAVDPPKAQQSPKAPDPAELKKQEELWKKVSEVIPRVMKAMNEGQTMLDFKVAEHSKRVIITVIDKETDKVIRQIPPEDVLRIADTLGQGHKVSSEGLIIDSKA